jgi:myosin heavy subunit
MLIRISLIIAIIAGLAAGTLNFLKVKEGITTLQTNLATQTDLKQKAERELAKTRSDLKATKEELATTKTALEGMTEERNTAVAEAEKRVKEAQALTEDVKKLTGEREVAQAEVARYRATGMTPEQIIAANKTIKDLTTTVQGLNGENKLLGQKINELENQLARYITPEKPVLLPAALRGKILVTDPKWNFVVLDIGKEQGVLEFGEMLVNRNGRLVGKIVVRTVEKDRSVANVVAGWEIGEVLEGDQVIPAHPAS